MMRNNHIESTKQKIPQESSFWFQFKLKWKDHITNWTLYCSLAIIFLTFFVTLNDKGNFNNTVHAFSSSMISIAISALCAIIAAVTITVVLYSRGSLHKMVEYDSIMAGLIFPYRFGGSLWAIITVISIFSKFVSFNIGEYWSYIFNLIYLLLVYDAVLYLIYIISEINQHLIESAIFETDDSEEVIRLLKKISEKDRQ